MTTVIGVVIGVVAASIVLVALRDPQPGRIVVAKTAAITPLPTTVGFSDGADFLSLSTAEVNQTLDLMNATGSRTLRLPIPWSTVEPVVGQQNWPAIDAIVDAAVERSMSVLGIIAFTPAWAKAPDGTGISSRPASAATFGDFAKSVAQRYNGKISAYEVWNEPNATMFYSPAPDPVGYTALLKDAYPKIKSVSSTITVIGGVLGSTIDTGSMMNPVTFLTQMYAAGAENSFDALSFHPYQYSLPFSGGMSIANSPLRQLVQMRELMIAQGDGAKKIWATEYGQPTAAGGDDTQNAYLVDFVTKWQEMPYTGPMMIYRTRDSSTGSSNPEDTFGIFRTDWTPKPAQQSLQWLLANGIPKSAEFQRFSTITGGSHGTVLSPTYLATPTVWAQRRTVDTIYETPSGFIASPNPVADKAVPFGVVPKTPFANGWQDFDVPNELRIFYSAGTGAHAVGGGIVAAWEPRLGLATTDEEPLATGGVSVTFAHGTITWSPQEGARVTYR